MAVTQIVRATQIKPGSNWRLVINDSTGAMADASAITAARALISDANGIPTHSAVTSTELGYVSGVTSAIQTQLDAKALRDLSNLTSTAINTSLISDTDNTDDLGTAAINWKDVHAKRLISSTSTTITASSGNVVLNPSGFVDASSKLISNVADPVADQDAATKSYVDSVAAGLDPKESVRLATTANHALTGLTAIDGVTPIAGDRILVKDQTDPTENGIYVAASGSWTRSTDMDGTPANEVSGGNFTFVEEGTTWADTGWVVSADGVLTVGTDDITWVQFSAAGTIQAGAGLTKTGNTIDVVSGDASLLVNANELHVQHDPAGATSTTGSGIQVNVDNTSIERSSNALRIASGAAGSGLGYSAGVLSVNVAASGGLEIVTDNLQIKSDTATANTIGVTTTSNGAGVKFDSNSFVDSGSETLALASGVAGAGLALTTGVLSVNVDDSTIEINSDTLRVKDAGITYAKTNVVTREVPSGAINGSNTAFVLANSVASGSEHVYLNGILQNVGAGNDYTISGSTITFLSAPITGSVILVSYWKA